MALLKAPVKKPRTTTVQVRLEEQIKWKLDSYASFIDASPSYVLGEALKLLFKRDSEFKCWLEQHPNNEHDREAERNVLTTTS